MLMVNSSKSVLPGVGVRKMGYMLTSVLGLFGEIVQWIVDIIQGRIPQYRRPLLKDRRPPSQWSEVERLYRQLKTNYEDRGDFPRAGDFHIGEKEARRQNLNTHWSMRLLLTIYRALSKYGERALPAAFCLLAVVLGCAGTYDFLGASLADPKAAQSLGLDPGAPLSFGDALRTSLEATFYPVRPVGFKELGPYILNVAQRIISPILVALLALALRQRVKR